MNELAKQRAIKTADDYKQKFGSIPKIRLTNKLPFKDKITGDDVHVIQRPWGLIVSTESAKLMRQKIKQMKGEQNES